MLNVKVTMSLGHLSVDFGLSYAAFQLLWSITMEVAGEQEQTHFRDALS